MDYLKKKDNNAEAYKKAHYAESYDSTENKTSNENPQDSHTDESKNRK
ncbi:hypothetical protein [Aminipila terrae]|uniref:Uncharacterized protein n=1 Tax=Aminipila terrae TaxID=2697030 RepID=A0A6P1MFD0_9FIRM|nr:hypothetical protein [Aminipila terrae]QHI72752.1 hypothetical protein Ami3637_10360 [Aminipila terrae]